MQQMDHLISINVNALFNETCNYCFWYTMFLSFSLYTKAQHNQTEVA